MQSGGTHLFFINSISQSHSSLSHIYQSCRLKKNKEKEICALQVIFAAWNWIAANYHSLNSYKALIAACHCLAWSNKSYFPPPHTPKQPPSAPHSAWNIYLVLQLIFLNRWLKSLWISKLPLKSPQYHAHVLKHFAFILTCEFDTDLAYL